MKRIRNIVFTSLICSLFFSCSNFMQGTGFIEELKDAIEYTAAPEIKVFVMVDDSDSGSTIPSGEQSYKLSQQYSAIYKPSSKYVLKNWEAVNKDGTAFEEPVVEFTSDIKNNEVNFKIIKNVENILIRPVVVQKLASDSVYPPNDNNSYPCDSTISIVFNKNLAPDNDLSKIDIKWQDTSVKSNYKEPVINNNILTIPADKNNLLRFTNDGTKSITVTIPADFYYLSDDEKISIGEEIKWSFLINPQTNSKVEVTFGVDEQYGTITPEGTKTYNIGESFNVTLTKNEYIDLQNWSIVDGDGNEITEDSISIKEDDEVFTFTILKELTAISISPVCFVTPQIVKIEPEYSFEGAPFDSDITIYFNKPIADIDFITNGFKLTDVNNTVDFKPLYRAELSEDKKVLKYIFNLDYNKINQIIYSEYGYNIYKNVMNKNNSDYVNLYVKIVDASIKDLDENVFYPEGYSYTIRIIDIQTKKPVTLENVHLCLSDSVKRSSTNEYGLNYYELNNNPVFFKSYTDDQLDKIGSSTEELPSDLKDNFIILYGADLQMAGYTTNSDDDNEYIYAQLNCEYDNRRPFTFNMEVYKYSEDTIPTEGYLYIKEKYKYLVSKYSYEIAQQLENSKDNIISIPKPEAFGAINETGTYLFKFYLQNDDGKTNPFYSFVSIYSNYDELLGKANVVIEPNNAYFYHQDQTKVTEENITLEINDYISKTLKFKFKKQTNQWNNEAVTYLLYSNAGQIPITYDIINDSKVLCFITNNAGEKTKFIVYNEVYTPFFDSMNFTTSVKYKNNINNEIQDVVSIQTYDLTDNQNIIITPIIELQKDGMIYNLTIELKPITYIYNQNLKRENTIPDIDFTNNNNTYEIASTEPFDEDYHYFVIYTDYEDNINKIFGINKIENLSPPTDSITVQTNSIMPFIVGIDNNGNFMCKNIDDINDDSIDFEPPTISPLNNLKWNALGQYMIPISDDNNLDFTKEYEYTWTENKLQNFDSYEIKKFKAKIIHDLENSTDNKKAYLLVQRPFRSHKNNKNTFNLSVKLSDEKGNEKIYYNILADIWHDYNNLEFLSTNPIEFITPTELPFTAYLPIEETIRECYYIKLENDNFYNFNNQQTKPFGQYESVNELIEDDVKDSFNNNFYSTTFYANPTYIGNNIYFRTIPIFRYYSTSPVSIPYKRVYSDDQNISVDINDSNKALIIFYALPSEVLKTEEGKLLTYKDLTPEIMVKSGVIHSMEVIEGRHTLTNPVFEPGSGWYYMAKIVFQDNSIEYSKIYKYNVYDD